MGEIMSNINTQISQATNVVEPKASVFKKIGFAFGDLGYNFNWFIVSAFLMIFYTDVFKVNPVQVGTLFLVVQIVSAVLDPIAGTIADKTRTRWGRYRPYILIAPFFLCGFMFLLFWAHPDWNQTAKLIYMYITFILASLSSTFVNMPYGGLNSVITRDTDERASYAGWRMTFAVLGSMLAGALVFPLISFFGNGNDARGYLLAVPVISLITLPMFLICFFSTKEVILPPKKGEKIPLKILIDTIIKNPPLLIVLSSKFLTGFMSYGRMAIMLFYFTYFVGNAAMFATYNVVYMITIALGSLAAPFFLKWLPNKAHVSLIGMLISAIFFAWNFWVSPLDNLILFYILTVLAAFGQGIFSTMSFAIIPDTVDYAQVKTGSRNDGFVYSITSLFLKGGGAVGPAVMIMILGVLGYVGGAEQSQTVLNGLNAMVFLAPAALCLITCIPLFFYKLDNKAHQKIKEKIIDMESIQS
jgi:sugar (glycoside-pentoside-hexuronide) transporter